jgi:hypothetical protein
MGGFAHAAIERLTKRLAFAVMSAHEGAACAARAGENPQARLAVRVAEGATGPRKRSGRRAARDRALWKARTSARGAAPKE